MKTWRSTFFWIIVIAWTIPAGAQDLEKAERFGLELERVVDQERYSLDSLSVLLESNARRIETEKRKTNPDRGLLMQWMSDGVALAQKIRDQQNRVDRIEQEWVILQKQLHHKYSQRIDSLVRVSQVTTSNEKSKELERQIWELTQRRLWCSPAVRTLSFNTRLVQTISLASIQDTLEKAIQKDYLERALNEVVTRLSEIRQKRKEFAAIVRLQEKLETFVQEIAEQNYSPLSRRTGLSLSPGLAYVDERYWYLQVRALTNLLRQFGVREVDLRTPSSVHSGSWTIEDYVELLEEAEKQLSDYEDYIKKKIH